MPERKVVITLDERHIQAVEQAVIDEDAAQALRFLREVVKPALDSSLNKGHCKPVFEWRGQSPERMVMPPTS